MSRRVPRARNARTASRFLTVVVASFAVVVSTIAPPTLAAASSAVAPSAAVSSATSVAQAASDPVQSSIAKTSLAGFNPGNIMSDAVFTDENTMTEAQIQRFLNSKVSKCVVGVDEDGYPFVCLKDLKVDTQTKAADSYCSRYSGASNESAARILYKVAQACDINPQVLIVMLQKEQGLVTHVWPSNWRYNKAMGQACPDTAPCNVAFAGFFAQVYGAARQMQIYLEGKYFQWYKAGKTWDILYHPNRACGTSPVYIANKATEALYYYTPYQPNRAALRAGYGVGDGCSSYGNRNFYNYFTDWFGSTQVPVNACDVPRDVGSAHRQYVTTTALNARTAPSTACDEGSFTLAEGTILQARRVTADGNWIEVHTLEGSRWLSREYLRYAEGEEAQCTVPYGTSPAHRKYVVRADVTARIGPWVDCNMNSDRLKAGAVVQATRVSGSRNWLQVQTHNGFRWIARSDVDYATEADIAAACQDPTGAKKAYRQYVVRASQQFWAAPAQECAVNSTTVEAGTVLQASRVSGSGDWLEVQTSVGPRWVEWSAVDQCAAVTGARKAYRQYVSKDYIGALLSPHSDCGTSVSHWGPGTKPQPIRAGTVVQATRVSDSGRWLEVQTSVGPRWVEWSAVDQCAAVTGARKAYRQYVSKDYIGALLSPHSDCGTSVSHWGPGTKPQPIRAGTVLQSTRVSDSGRWLEVQTSVGPRWVAWAAVTQCSPNPYGARKAYNQYVVQKPTRALDSPLPECTGDARYWGPGTDPAVLETGTVLQATRVSGSGKWLEVATEAGRRWIWRQDVRAN